MLQAMIDRLQLRRSIGTVTLVAVLCSAFIGLTPAPADAAPPPLQLPAKAAVLMDATTGDVLFAQNADAPVPPASLTKLMTLHVAFQRIAAGGMKREDKVTVTPDAWSAKMRGSSVMFLEPGQNVTVGELLKGIAIPSGNDASVALAQHMAGTVDAFVAMMNKEAQDMGYKAMKFADPAGLSPQNSATAREFGDFARRYVQLHPEALGELHSVKEFTYPLAANLPKDKTAADSPPVTQRNRNLLLWEFEGADGLKTGFIDESGYNIAVTAKRGDMRLIAVILGVAGRDEAEGSRKRADAAAAALNWGFQNYVTVKPPVPAAKPVRVWKGAANELTLEPARPVVLTVERGLEGKLQSAIQQNESVIAPVKKGAELGDLIFSADGKEIARVKLVAATEVAQGGFFKRTWDGLRLWVAGLLNRKK